MCSFEELYLCPGIVSSCCNNSSWVITDVTGFLGFVLVGVQKRKKIGLQASNSSLGLERKGNQCSPETLLHWTAGEMWKLRALLLPRGKINPWMWLLVGQRNILGWPHLLKMLFWNSYRLKCASLWCFHISLILLCCFPEIIKQKIPVFRAKWVGMVPASLELVLL